MVFFHIRSHYRIFKFLKLLLSHIKDYLFSFFFYISIYSASQKLRT